MNWLEYQETVAYYDEIVASAKARSPRDADYDEAVFDAVRTRWQARLRDPSWEQKRADFIWYTAGRCEECGGAFADGDLQLHHLHYDTLWYESKATCSCCAHPAIGWLTKKEPGMRPAPTGRDGRSKRGQNSTGRPPTASRDRKTGPSPGRRRSSMSGS